MHTIIRFADLTGISASALRFYERKGLLAPARRLPNGYRVYAGEQVAVAQLINSLREAGIGIAAIRDFVRLAGDGRQAMLGRWREEIAARLLSIRMADQYLRGLKPDEPQIHLHRWERPSTLVWLPAEAPAGPLPFAEALSSHRRELERLGTVIESGGFARATDLVDGRLIGEVGFRVKPGRGRPTEARVEQVPPTLFATLECGVDDEQAAHRVFRFLHDFGYVPSGLHLERYLPGVTDRYQLMIAVTR